MLIQGNKTKPPRVLSIFALVMINVIAVDSLRSLPFSAIYGFSLVFYYIVAAFIFFLPIAFVSAELATAWPNKGGIYVWVREAFGDFWGFMVIWLQWIYNIVWYPTILLSLAAILAYFINPDLAENRMFMLIVVLTFFWGATFLNCLGMKMSSAISIFSALIGTIIPMVFIIILGIVWMYLGNPIHIKFTQAEFFPDLTDPKMLAFLTALMYGLVGIELSAAHADEVKNPGKSYPRAILLSTIIILGTLTLSSLAIAMVVPHNQLSVVTGLVQAYEIFFKAFHLEWMSSIITVLIIIGGIGSVAAWIIGPTKGLLVAAQDGNAPKLFAKTNKKGAPVALLITQAIICTVLCLIFLLMPSVSSSYWILTAMTAQLSMFVYIALFAAALWLRYKRPGAARAYRIPFKNIGMWVTCVVGTLTSLFVVALGFVPPSQIKIGSTAVYEFILVTGVLILSLPAMFIYYRYGRPHLIKD